MKYIIYCTTNSVNDKVYIGRHKTENPDIFDGYIGCGVKISMPSTYINPSTAFQCAVKKFGTSVFKRSILFVYDTLKEAVNKEKEIVNSDFIKLDTNYNMVIGGGNINEEDIIYQFDSDGRLVKKWETIDEAQSFFNCTFSAFRTALHFREKLFGYFWSRDEIIDLNNFSKGDTKKHVYKYTKGGKCIQEFESVYQAAKEEGMSTSTLVTAIQGNILVKKQFYYSYSIYETFIPKDRKQVSKCKFYLYNLEGDYLQKFENYKELMSFMGVKSISSISDIINRRNGLYKTYQISTEYFDKLNKIENKDLNKSVDVYDKTGVLLDTCESVQKAAKKYNVKTSSVNRVLRGLANTAGGYVFKFHKN